MKDALKVLTSPDHEDDEQPKSKKRRTSSGPAAATAPAAASAATETSRSQEDSDTNEQIFSRMNTFKLLAALSTEAELAHEHQQEFGLRSAL